MRTVTLVSAMTVGAEVTYAYDALGRRVLRSESRYSTNYTYDGQDVLMDDDSTDGITKYQNAPGIDNKLKQKTGSTAKYFLQDHLGSTVGLTNSSGNVTESNSYDSFGNATNSTFPSRYQFTGREFDSFTGLQYSRARWYHPQIGRFISEDPIGFRGGDVNLYGYVRNQPLIFRDPRGLYPGVDVLAYPNVLTAAAAALTTAGSAVVAAGGAIASSPAVAVGAAAATGVAIGAPVGIYTANRPGNPFVNGPLNPFPIWDKIWSPTSYPIPIAPPRSPTTSGPVCQPMPRAIPWPRSPTIPWLDPEPEPEPDEEGCAEEISACVQQCAAAQFDPDLKNVWGGSRETCLRGCIPPRCQKRFKF